jgi:hypothetical protein
MSRLKFFLAGITSVVGGIFPDREPRFREILCQDFLPGSISGQKEFIQ